MKPPIAVAIDGPSGVGKSTVARLIAEALGVPYLDTGAMYRAAGLLAQRRGITLPITDASAVSGLISQADIRFEQNSSGARTFLDGEDVSTGIRTPEIALYASAVAAIPEIRRKLASLQRHLALTAGGVLEGRDIGTKVIPETPFKFFLTASPEVRAGRRYRELEARGTPHPLERILDETKLRDKADETRADSPLRYDDSYVLVDTGSWNPLEVASFCLQEIQKRSTG